MVSEQLATPQTPALQLNDWQSKGRLQVLPVAHFPQCPPQSTSLSSLFLRV
jgi:hypothetical protein